jgi:hypothetical protein
MESVQLKYTLEVLEHIERQSDDGWERLVTGVVADPENVDYYGNMIDADVIKNAAYRFMERYQHTGISHLKDEDGVPVLLDSEIRVVESWITREATTLGGKKVPRGAWVMTSRILNDDIWSGVLNGTYTGYSFEALAKRVEI